MIKLHISCTWDELIYLILEAEPQLAPQDLAFLEGDDEALVRHLAQKLGRSYEKVTGWIESVAETTSKAS